MKKAIAIVIQTIIFITAWALVTPDVIEDNTHLFGLIGDIEVTKGNTDWVMLGALVATTINIWFWWPKSQSVTTNEKPAEDTKSAKAENAIDQDPKTPTLD